MTYDRELRARAKRMRKDGTLIRVIAVDLDVPKATITRWLNPELEKRERLRARKRKYDGASKCPRCKRRKTKTAEFCRSCRRALQNIERTWTKERVIEAIQKWAIEKGHAPIYSEWKRSGKGHPAISSILDGPNPTFSSWSEALLAAGFVPRQRRSGKGKMPPEQRAEMRRQMRENKIRAALRKENDEYAASVRDDAGVPDQAGSTSGH